LALNFVHILFGPKLVYINKKSLDVIDLRKPQMQDFLRKIH